MRCRLHERALRLDFDAAEARAMETHAAECRECAETIAALRSARGVLRRHEPRAERGAREKVWRAIEREERTSWLSWSWAAAGVAAAVVAAVAVLTPAREVNDVPEAPITVVTPVSPVVREPFATSSGAKFQVVQSEPQLTELILERGTASLPAFEPARMFEVVTVDARVKAIGSIVDVERTDVATRVAVAKGSATVWVKGYALPVTVRAGERVEVSARREEVAAREEKPRAPRKAAPKAEPAAPIEPPEQPETPPLTETLREAREALHSDAPKAARLAERVLVEAPRTQLEADALAVLADAQRRRGELGTAADLYGRLVEHPQGRSYAEEALLQRAMIFAKVTRPQLALEDLARAEELFPRGPTAPERAALAAELHLSAGDPLAAARAIERAPSEGRSLKLLQRRLEVARALPHAHSQRARSLLQPVIDPRTPDVLRREAVQLFKNLRMSEAAGDSLR